MPLHAREQVHFGRVAGRAADGRALGLEGMIGEIVASARGAVSEAPPGGAEGLSARDPVAVAQCISWLEARAGAGGAEVEDLRKLSLD